MNWYVAVMKKYADFSGRARRKEYWMFVLFNLIFLVVAAILDNLFGTAFKIESGYGSQALPYGWLYLIYALAVIIPGLAVCVRRLHDVGKSGWMLLIAFIPLIGAIWLLVLYCTAGNQGDNQYGPDPKAGEII
jgi:uncharacterized membrane protein YhaH (DUF805 family)